MAGSTKKITKVTLEHMDWKQVDVNLRETQDLWWLNEIDVEGKKKTQLENALEKGRSFRQVELLAPIKWLTPENYQKYVRRVVEIIQKFKDKNKTLDGDTDEAFEEVKEEQKKFEDKPIKNLNDKSIDELSKLLKNILQMEGDEGEDISANAIWNILKKELKRNNRKYDKKGILIKFDMSSTSSGKIYWVKGKNKSETPCSFRTFQNKLAKIRKNTH